MYLYLFFLFFLGEGKETNFWTNPHVLTDTCKKIIKNLKSIDSRVKTVVNNGIVNQYILTWYIYIYNIQYTIIYYRV